DDNRNFNTDDVFTSNSVVSPRVFDRFYSSSSSEDEEETGGSSSNYQRRLDYMLEFLDRKLSTSAVPDQPLPEYEGSGGGSGIFKPPVRGPVRSDRPPSLEIRPRPLREDQLGRFLRNITLLDDGSAPQLWAGSESGIRVWDMKNDIYGEEGGDEEGTVRYCESVQVPAATLCVTGDASNRVVWSGHRDGRVICWKMLDSSHKVHGSEQSGSTDRFLELFSWQAHRGPVLSMVVSCYGDIWSGSESGSLKMWPWEAIEKSFSLIDGERHGASLYIERSFIDLISQLSQNGVCCSMFTSDIKSLISDSAGAKVWASGYQIFSLWDARTRELLKVFNIDGQIENMTFDSPMEDETKLKLGSTQKPQNSYNFFQRSRNAIFGAADAVLRAAAKGAFGVDNQRAEALASTIDGMVWVGCTNGVLLQWDGNGNRVQDFQYHSSAVQCICTVATRIWVGYLSGTVQVLDLSGTLLGEWVAHNSPIIGLAVGVGYLFTLANHGGIRAWSVTSPGPLDNKVCAELAGKEFLYTRLETLKVLAGTWNVAQGRADTDSVVSWLGSVASGVDIIVIGLQEVEMGAGFLAVSAAKETMGLEGSGAGQWWLDIIGKVLDNGSTFLLIGSRQLAGLLISVWVRSSIRRHVGDIDVAAVPCGFGRAIGNKGAVGLRMRIYDRVFCFVNCHFAAHLEAVNRRNADFDHVYRTMVFSRPPVSAAAGIAPGINTVEGMPELSQADLVIFLGDFNYRLDGISYEEARDFMSQRCFDWLKERDQLLAEMKAGNVFQGMREAVIRFPPTYKFERHVPGLSGYDSGEKKRIPAWCDRILYRDCRSASSSSCSLDCPVVSTVLLYESCMDVTDSDHKPVRCIFNVEVARVDESIRRQEFGEIVRSKKKMMTKPSLDDSSEVPEVIVSTNNIILQNQDTSSILRITNKHKKNTATYEVCCEGLAAVENGHASDYRPRSSFGFPRWLQVIP
ncbi:hypothetical protein M569_09204, partial [Genlisea aurea]